MVQSGAAYWPGGGSGGNLALPPSIVFGSKSHVPGSAETLARWAATEAFLASCLGTSYRPPDCEFGGCGGESPVIVEEVEGGAGVPGWPTVTRSVLF